MSGYTIKDIAKECGVGVSTVSRALNNHPDINKETKKRIMEVVEARKFSPSTTARDLKRIRSNTIAVLVKGLDNPLFHKMMDIFQLEIESKKYDFVFQRVGAKDDEISVALDMIKERKLKGIIFLGGNFTHSEEQLGTISVPFVLATISPGKNVNTDIYSSVSVDDVKESYKITDYLCSIGHKRIAILLPDNGDESVGSLRLEGYKQALSKHGITVEEQLVRYSADEGDSFSMENGYKLMRQLLSEDIHFTGVFAASDKIAVGAMKALLEAGKKIPEDVSVCGFDGLDIARYYHPTITTIAQPIDDMAGRVITQLFSLIEETEANSQITFEGKLLVGESTGPV